ncbi:hypothetical protein MKW98_026612 [Papaver atlanticum]|uniref:Uncharacterized protein n=1 Tax=Papaver atlanticum TaxID=357466 RepID=A0AAD4RZK0_9MAGN|nr:hypothetical protein MKW98_026612 [Papaver atlanticum]
MAPTAVVDKEQVSLPVKTAVATAGNALLGAAAGVLYKTIAKKFVFLQTPLISPRSFAVFSGIDGGMTCAMKGIRGKDDTKARAVAGFTSGFMLYLVGNMPSPPRVPFAIGTGIIFALYNGLVHEAEHKHYFSIEQSCSAWFCLCAGKKPLSAYNRRMLSELGLEVTRSTLRNTC